MAWLNLILLAFLALAGCGDEGGISGTGISGGSETASSVIRDSAETIFEGNVSEVTEPFASATGNDDPLTRLAIWLGPVATAHANNPVAGIRVRIEGMDDFAWTDEDGEFRVEGPVEGPVTILFERDDGAEAALGTHAPLGSVMTLRNVAVDFGTGAATAEREIVRFTGIVDDKACADEKLIVSSESDPDPSPFTVLLTQTTPQDAEGDDVDCHEIDLGETIWVKGDVQDDGEIVATAVETAENSDSFDPAGNDGSDPERMFRGSLAPAP